MTLPLPAAEVHALLARQAHHPSAFLATNRDTRHFTVPGIDGLIAYRQAGRRHLVMAAGITAPPAQRATLLELFLAWARNGGRRVIAVQMLREDAELLSDSGFTVNQIGASYSRSLAQFKLAGTPFIKLRNKIAKARKAGVRVLELGLELAPDADIAAQMGVLDARWLASKGAHAKELSFLIGEVGALDRLDRAGRRIFVAMQDARLLGYILYTASFGRYQGWMHDLTRRVPDAPPGVMELINVTAIERFRQEDAGMLNFGFTPLTGLDPAHEQGLNSSRRAAWVFAKLARHGQVIYPAASQVQYKLKWAPDIVVPEYIAFQGGFTLGGLWQFLRLTRAI